MSKPLRIGLIGAGMVSRHHLIAWADIPDRARVVAIADPSRENAARRADEFSISQIYADAEAMLAASELDAVDIAAPRQFHAPLVRLAAKRGLPVLCQKPLAPNLQQAIELAAEVKNQARLMVHENWRFRGYYRDAAAWLREGRIGDRQAGAAYPAHLGRAAGSGWIAPGAAAAALHARGKAHAGRGSADPSPRHAAHAARTVAGHRGGPQPNLLRNGRRRRRGDPDEGRERRQPSASSPASPRMDFPQPRSTGSTFSEQPARSGSMGRI